ncbi:SDR family oxidoreductase [Streptomyces vinaceus]|uniref:SDR family oxidoreductase n=1 Tax=Streptomyces vinaceus TaxID=1960 RepID=UPI00382F27F2
MRAGVGGRHAAHRRFGAQHPAREAGRHDALGDQGGAISPPSSPTARRAAVRARTAPAAGAGLVLAGPDADRPADTAAALPGPARIQVTDLTDEGSIAALAETAGQVDHVVATAAVPANGPVSALVLADVQRAFAAKVFGPLLLAKHLAGRMARGGSLTF